MQESIDKLEAGVKAARDKEAKLHDEICNLASSDQDPKRNSHIASQIKELDTQRRQAAEERQRLKAAKAELLGDYKALERRTKGRAGARANIKAALDSLTETKAAVAPSQVTPTAPVTPPPPPVKPTEPSKITKRQRGE